MHRGTLVSQVINKQLNTEIFFLKAGRNVDQGVVFLNVTPTLEELPISGQAERVGQGRCGAAAAKRAAL